MYAKILIGDISNPKTLARSPVFKTEISYHTTDFNDFILTRHSLAKRLNNYLDAKRRYLFLQETKKLKYMYLFRFN